MAEQTSRLAIIIDSSGAQKNAESLTSALIRMTQTGDKATTGAEKVTKVTRQESAAFDELKDKIIPVNSALSNMGGAPRKALEDISKQLNKTGMSAAQTANAMRMVPAQFTDIVVSLASGQAPLTVLLQQGGQLKDMFGGVGPALGGIGRYALGLIGPFTGLSAVVAGLAFAWHQNQEEMSALNKSASTLNNISGLTLTQMKALAQASSALGVSYSNSIESISSLSKAINTNTDLYPRAIKAAHEYAWASGQDLPEVVALFNQLSANGGKSIDELDDKFGFLTVSQRKQADEALRSGNIAEAQRIAFEGLSGTLESLTSKLNQGATGWDNFWKSVGKGASGGWQTIKEIAGGDYFDNADVRKYLERSRLRDQKTQAGTWTREDERYFQMLNQSSPAVREYTQAQKSLADTTKEAAGNKYLKSLSDQVNDNADAVTRSRKALQALDNEFNSQPSDVRASGQADYAARRAQLEKALKDAEEAQNRKPRTKAYTEDAATRLLDQIKQQTTAIDMQLQSADRLTSATQQRIRFEQQIADIKTKLQLTADQKSLLARSGEILQAFKVQEALSNQLKTLDDYQKMQEQVKSKDEQTNDLLRERIELLEKARATGKLKPGEYEQTRSNIYQNTPVELPSAVKNVVGNLSPTGGNLSGTFNGLQNQYSDLDQAQQKLQAWLQAQEDAYSKAAQVTSEGEARMTAIRQQAAQANQAIEWQKYEIITSATQSFMDSGLQILSDGFGQQSAIYKAAFAASKAYAIAQSMVAINAGIAQAANGPFPANIIAMASVAAHTASIVSNIKAVADTGFMSGGYTGNGATRSISGVVHGQEYVFDAAATKRIGVSNLEAIRNGGLDATLSRPGYGTGAQSISNNQSSTTNHNSFSFQQSFSGKIDDATLLAINQSNRQMASQIERKLTNDIANPQGQFGRTLKGYYARSRRE